VNDDQNMGWRKSSYCGSNACVEVAQSADAILVRDSKDPASPVLSFTKDEWTAFVAGVNAGEFEVH
jgi:predicted secreted Zn-dependent protease